MKIDIFNIMAIIILVSSIVALIGKIDIGQSYLLSIWVVLAMWCNSKNKRCESNCTREDYITAIEKFKELPHINSQYEIQEDWKYTPTLYHFDGEWHVTWIDCQEGDGLNDFNGSTPEEAIEKAYRWYNLKFCNG